MSYFTHIRRLNAKNSNGVAFFEEIYFWHNWPFLAYNLCVQASKTGHCKIFMLQHNSFQQVLQSFWWNITTISIKISLVYIIRIFKDYFNFEKYLLILIFNALWERNVKVKTAWFVTAELEDLKKFACKRRPKIFSDICHFRVLFIL